VPDLELRGCRTTPLLSYLKALGVFRHVAGADPTARLWWRREGFAMLRSRFDQRGLVEFFVDEYEPSPITSPWNGGSGYYTGDNAQAITAIEGSDQPRFAALRQAIVAARELVASSPTTADGKVIDKEVFLARWRATCSDAALAWFDSAIVLTEAGPSMNPLLGTGGNDGRFEFSNNFLARLIDCLPQCFGKPPAASDGAGLQLRGALYGDAVQLTGAAVGMFDPGSAGLPNSSSATAENAIVNSWDFVLLLEGALLFGGGVARRLSEERATFPFTVRDPARIGCSLEIGADGKTRGETWLPIWMHPGSLASVGRLFAEGRTQDRKHQARSGREMLRAVSDVGVERGVDSFERIVYAERFGRNYVAVPAGGVLVRPVRSVALTRSADSWLRRARGVDSAQVRRCLGTLDRAAAEIASAPDERSGLERWLLALADMQLAVARRPASRAVSEPTHLRPLSGLDRRIVTGLVDSVEHRLARSLAAVGRLATDEVSLRSLVEPVSATPNWRFAWTGARASGDLTVLRPESLLIALARRGSSESVPPERRARLADIAIFLAGAVDDARLVRLAYAFSLCDPCDQRRTDAPRRQGGIDRLYAICRLVTGDPIARRPGGPEREVRPAPDIVPMLAAGNGKLAALTAARRLRAEELAPARAVEAIDRTPAQARRIAAALAFPLHPDDRKLLELAVLSSEHAYQAGPPPEGART
jgi:CRISPR-associated protein Csx17